MASPRKSTQKKKAKLSKVVKQPATKVNWIFSANSVSSKEVSSICLKLFTKEKTLLDDLFEYAIVGLKEVANKHSYDIIGYVQLGKRARWTRKDVINHLGYEVKTFSSNDTVFGHLEKSLQPGEIIKQIKAIADVDNVTEGGTVRKKGTKKYSLKRDDDEKDDDDDSKSDDGDGNECLFFHKNEKRSSVDQLSRVARATTSLGSSSNTSSSPMRISKVPPSNVTDVILPNISNYTTSMQNTIEATITRLFEQNNSRLIARLVTGVNENTTLIDDKFKTLITDIAENFKILLEILVAALRDYIDEQNKIEGEGKIPANNKITESS
mmetsp:Transcript_7736/g.11236  ORF Transcript_7736/g.11236 Transcript_7736/m.11236 type:complete len:324 (+) Transcript_7736:121-1092(+)|eukprot:CAMPEP_0172413888 /NCGR_PEP_ID=MMETSP1064-20121228/442_1 /TAXON_ID=202472 /ORGANISM="Aulacoseira subarctica , Strain CCAP 1002/5" /LENGTH=323 /DNA_ID=CAMNT_0013150279 /DNA_START=52 /DNA_END=1023 /DNA_ORIENTATION=-